LNKKVKHFFLPKTNSVTESNWSKNDCPKPVQCNH